MLKKAIARSWFQKASATELGGKGEPMVSRLQPEGATDCEVERVEGQAWLSDAGQLSKTRRREYIDGAFARLSVELRQKRLLERQNRVLRMLLDESERAALVLRVQNEGLLEAVRGLDRLLEALLEAMGSATTALRGDCELLERRLEQPLERRAAGVGSRPKARWKCTALWLCFASLFIYALLHPFPICVGGPQLRYLHPPPV